MRRRPLAVVRARNARPSETMAIARDSREAVDFRRGRVLDFNRG